MWMGSRRVICWTGEATSLPWRWEQRIGTVQQYGNCSRRYSPSRCLGHLLDSSIVIAVQLDRFSQKGASPMETQRLDLPIHGMNCAGCAARIEKALQHLSGIQKAQVNFATARATVHYA